MEFLPPSDPLEKYLDLQEIAERVDLSGLVEVHSIDSDKFDLYPENKRLEIYEHNVRIFQAYIANVLLQDLALPDRLREYLCYTVDYCERYLDGTLSAEECGEEDCFVPGFA